ncbi:DUF3017 domain-containing protein [Streptomyces parvulus]|uniref:DUF3017 domain-containing protein n=1 Tax=Streptomyces parvulus TaxID=146923 RepID=UPI0026BB0C25
MPAEDTRAGRADGAEDTERTQDNGDAVTPGGAPDAADTARAAGDSGAPGADESPGGPDDPDGITVRDPVSAPDAQGRPKRATRRFPLFTRDTARPEGGGRAAGGDAPAPARQWPVLTVAGLVGVGLLLTGLDVFRWGLVLVGVALLLGAALRWSVPDVGMLAVRSRFTDIVTYGVLGAAIAMLALMAQPNAPLKIPFLNDLLHFTVSS